MWPFSKRLEDVVCPTKKVRIHGVKFELKKIDPQAFLSGAKVMLQEYDTYRVEKQIPLDREKVLAKTRDHYKDVFMAAVASPKLKRKEDAEGLLVDYLFTEWDLAHELYEAILEHTYGKKKLKLAILRAKRSQTLTA